MNAQKKSNPPKKSEAAKVSKASAPKKNMSVGAKQKLFASVFLFILLTAYVVLFFVPEFPNALWIRLLLPLLLAPLMSCAIFFLLKKSLTAKDIEYIKDEENFARALKAMKQAKFYTKKFPGFPKGIRKEIIPSAVSGLVLFILMTLISPCRPPEMPMPDFAEMAAEEFYHPYLFAVSDNVLALAPPMLMDTGDWAANIPPKYLEWTMYADMFRNHFELAHANGNLSETKTSGVWLAMAQASLLAGKGERAAEEYQAVLAAGKTDPEIAFQAAIALAYSGKLEDAAKALGELDAKAVAEAIGDDQALPHWKLALRLLRGELNEFVCADYKKFFLRQSNALARFNQKKQSADDSASNEKKSASSSLNTEIRTEQQLLERRVRAASTNMAVVQLLSGDCASAVSTANAVLPLTRSLVPRGAKILQMCALNTKAHAAASLGTDFSDNAKEWDQSMVFSSPEEYFTRVRKMFEEILALERLETETADPAYRKSVCFLGPWVSEAQAALTNQFSSEQFPDAKTFQTKYADLFELIGGLHEAWNLTEAAKVPFWAVPVEQLLMKNGLILEGRDTDENYAVALKTVKEKFQNGSAYPLLVTETLMKELQVLGRFAAKEGLTISMLNQLQEDQKKLVRETRDAVPENHPLIARQALVTLRLTLIQKDLSKKALGTVHTALTQAEDILAQWKYPEQFWLVQELTAAQTLTQAMKEKEQDKIQAVFEPLLKKQESNLFRQSSVYRDCAFAFQHRGFTAEADAMNRSARTIFNQQIFRDNTRHFLILQMDKILKH
ncbi:MAG: hypothetical protein Q4D17_04625 [Planctomycetia bacterium]|nr:hypothetical protein [Planctomycetia bacterium]